MTHGEIVPAVPAAGAARTDIVPAGIVTAPPAPPVRPARPETPAGVMPHESFETLDRMARAMAARATLGVSPTAMVTPWVDWAQHLSRAPGRQIELGLQAIRSAARVLSFTSPAS